MKLPMALVFCAVALAAPVCGTQYWGSITQTVTSTNDPLYHVGEIFHGHYSYESPAIDGTFYTNIFDPSGTLDGLVFLPFSTNATYEEDGEMIELTGGWGGLSNPLSSSVDLGTLVISNGHVADFDWLWDLGGFSGWFEEDWFSAASFYTQTNRVTSGTIAMSDPLAVGDTTPTAALLALTVSVWWLASHWLARASGRNLGRAKVARSGRLFKRE